MHLNCSVTGACSTPDQFGLLEHPILELGLPPTEKYPGPGACISPTLGAQGCASAASLEKLIFSFFLIFLLRAASLPHRTLASAILSSKCIQNARQESRYSAQLQSLYVARRPGMVPEGTAWDRPCTNTTERFPPSHLIPFLPPAMPGP